MKIFVSALIILCGTALILGPNALQYQQEQQRMQRQSNAVAPIVVTIDQGMSKNDQLSLAVAIFIILVGVILALPKDKPAPMRKLDITTAPKMSRSVSSVCGDIKRTTGTLAIPIQNQAEKRADFRRPDPSQKVPS
ncbi:hypothetical protein ACFL6U_02685 [Planctomycetota bacterium]